MSVTSITAAIRLKVKQDLARSGLDDKDLRRLRIVPLTRDETAAITDGKLKALAYKLPYFDLTGKPIDFFRVRFLEPVHTFGDSKPIRYTQPPGTAPHAYFPPYVNWDRVARDPSITLVITEGEKKAAAVSKVWHPTIGLGGVWSWRAAKLGQALITDLEQIEWRGRNVVLIFDTDPLPKVEVIAALEGLVSELQYRGAVARTIRLPPIEPGVKTGVDDYLVKHGAAALRSLEADDVSSDAVLEVLNAEVALIRKPAGVYHFETGVLFSQPKQLASTLYAAHIIRRFNAAGNRVELNAFSEWLKWPRRRVHTEIRYEPGAPTDLADGALNVWPGWGVAPRTGSVKPFEALLDYQFAGDPAARAWFVRWLAYPLQRPGTKHYTAAVLWSNDTGTGKSLIGMTLGRVYGRNFSVIGEGNLHGAFNDWQVNKQFILGEEVTGSDRRAEADRLKHLITGESVLVNQKYQPPYTIRSCVNYLFTTNHPDAFLLDAADRRFFVYEVGARASKPSQAFFDEYDEWYRSEAGAAALFEYLLRVDLAGFNPRALAPVTAARESMIAVSGSEIDFVVRELVAAPDHFLRIGEAPIPRDLFTYEELLRLLDPEGRRRFTAVGLARALTRVGSVSFPTRISTTTSIRLVAVRNLRKWRDATHAERVDHYVNAGHRAAKF